MLERKEGEGRRGGGEDHTRGVMSELDTVCERGVRTAYIGKSSLDGDIFHIYF